MLGKYLKVFLIYKNDHFNAADGLKPLNQHNSCSQKDLIDSCAFTVLRICVGRQGKLLIIALKYSVLVCCLWSLFFFSFLNFFIFSTLIFFPFSVFVFLFPDSLLMFLSNKMMKPLSFIGIVILVGLHSLQYM